MSHNEIRRVAVVGAGVMGRGIAAILANSGTEVFLMDYLAPMEVLERLKSERPAALYTPAFLDSIHAVSLSELETSGVRFPAVDWVIEAIPERLELKRELFKKLESWTHQRTIIASNTSGLSIEEMLEGFSESFKKRFLVTHFFNPVRYMKLVEMVAARETSKEVTEQISTFIRDKLGKGVVFGKDTPNFIANRIGTYTVCKIITSMEKFNLSISDIDQIFGKPMGRPNSAIFRTIDLVGLDTFLHVANYSNITEPPSFIYDHGNPFQLPDFIHKMVDTGLLGSKTKKGFYQKTKTGIEVIDPDTLSYKPQEKRSFASVKNAQGTAAERIRSLLVDGEDEAAEFARYVTLPMLAYALSLLGEITDHLYEVDRALKWGYNWELGPFEICDTLGFDWCISILKNLGIAQTDYWNKELDLESFYRGRGQKEFYFSTIHDAFREIPQDPKSFSFQVLRRTKKPLLENDGATLWDIEDGVTLLQFHTKMNTIDDDIISMIHQSIDLVEEDYDGLVIATDSDHFSAGANLFIAYMYAQQKNWAELDSIVYQFQHANKRLRYCNKPVVAAPCGLTLGGGAEIAMAADEIQAAGELYMGLVEVGVGLVPAGGGTVAMMRRFFGALSEEKVADPMVFIRPIFEKIGLAKVSTSAEEARKLGFLDKRDGITINRDHLILAAKGRVLGLAAAGYRPPRPMKFRLPGGSGLAALDSYLYGLVEMQQATTHDRLICQQLASILCGGDTTPSQLTTEEELLELERNAFMRLIKEEKTQARMAYMLEHNKPLRN